MELIGNYIPRKDVSKEVLKQAILEYCCFVIDDKNRPSDEAHILEHNIPVWELFKSVDFDLDRFFIEDIYKQIDNDIILYNVVMGVCLGLVDPMSKYIIDELNGYLSFLERCTNEVSDGEIMKYLYFCKSDEEIWELYKRGIGDVKSMYKWYMGIDPLPKLSDYLGIPFQGQKDELKAKRFLDYVS